MYPELLFKKAWKLLGLEAESVRGSELLSKMSKQTLMSCMQTQLCVKYESGFTLPIPNDVSSCYGVPTLSGSGMQTEIGSYLKKCGFNCVEEWVLAEGDEKNPARNFLSLDLADLENKVGVEVDGPAHYCNIIDDDELEKKKIGKTGDERLDRQQSFTR